MQWAISPDRRADNFVVTEEFRDFCTLAKEKRELGYSLTRVQLKGARVKSSRCLSFRLMSIQVIDDIELHFASIP